MELVTPEVDEFAALLSEQKREISTTMAYVRALNILLKNKSVAKHIVPIIADEARTFGMEGLFRQIGIYNPHGQNYQPQDREQVAYYKESTKGKSCKKGLMNWAQPHRGWRRQRLTVPMTTQ